MRVIAGEARGFHLHGPKGLPTRPTSDKIRGAIFSILEAAVGIEDTRVLDLYAGTGALGIEALSRGARWADFVEADEKACALIRVNLLQTHLAERGRVVRSRVERFIAEATNAEPAPPHSPGPEPYDIILLDPPYADPLVLTVLSQLAQSAFVGGVTTVVLEHSRRLTPPETAGDRLRLLKTRCHGDTCVSIYLSAAPRSVEIDGEGRQGA